MKAITFLEWVKNDIINPSQSVPYGKPAPIEIAQSTAEQLVKIYDFYSQPFKPELITELFEGWEKYSEDNYGNRGRIFLGNGIDGITYDRGGYLLGKNGLAINEWEMGVYINFATLNDFISDCQRAGIELTFKQEVINKYFK